MMFRPIVLCLATLATAAPGLPARQVQNQAAPPDTTVRPPRPIPPGEIVSRADSLRERLRVLEQTLASQSSLAAIDSALPHTAAEIQSLAPQSDSASLMAAGARILNDVDNQWKRLQSELAGRQRTVDARSQLLDSLSTLVARSRAVWTITRDSLPADLPGAVRDRVNDVFAVLDSTDAHLRNRLDAVLTLANAVSQQRAIVTDALGRVQAISALRQQELLSPDQPPLWRVFSTRDTTASVGTLLGRSWQQDVDVLSQFAHDEQVAMVGRALLFVLLTLGFIMLKRRSLARIDGDEAITQAAALLAKPVSAALLITLLSARIVHRSAPQIFWDLNGLLFLLPLARLIPDVVPKNLRPVVYGLLPLFALEVLDSSLIVDPVFDRLLQLAVMGVIFAGLSWFVRLAARRDVSADRDRRWWHAFLMYVRFCLVTIAIALLADTFGLGNLSDLLMTGVLVSLFAAVLLFVGVIIVRAAVHLLLQTPAANRLAAIRHNQDLIARRVDSIVSLATLAWWAWFVSDLFRVRGPAWAAGRKVWDASLSAGSISISVGDVVAFILVLWAASLVSRFVRFILQEDVLPRLDLARGVPQSIATLSTYVILGLGLVFAAAAAGVTLSQVTLLAGAFGVGIGFGLQSVVNNFVSGLILIFERPIQIGDIVQIDTLMGTTKRIGIRASTVRTFDGADVIVPNGDLVAGRVINWSLSDRLRRIELKVGVEYGTDPQLVLNILKDIAAKHEKTLNDPAPTPRFLGFGESSLDFSLWVWSKLDDWIGVATELNVQINAALEEAGITIPFPQRDLHLRSVDHDAARALEQRGSAETDYESVPPGPGAA
jgi:potassium-dependent mechanosensitive channel